jgi:hypothetical protein
MSFCSNAKSETAKALLESKIEVFDRLIDKRNFNDREMIALLDFFNLKDRIRSIARL